MATAFSLLKRVNGILAGGLLLLGTNASAQQSREVGLLTRYEVSDGYNQTIRAAISEYVASSMERQHNIMTEAYFEEQDSSVVWIIERWQSKKDMETMKKDATYKRILQFRDNKLLQQTRSIYLTDLEPLSKEIWRKTPGKEDQPITIMLFVDSKPGTQENFKATYHTAMPLFRSEPGVINYQLSQLQADDTKFVTYEKFRNEAAFRYHLNFPPIKPVIDYLNSSIRIQPFQRGLHRLIMFAPVN